VPLAMEGHSELADVVVIFTTVRFVHFSRRGILEVARVQAAKFCLVVIFRVALCRLAHSTEFTENVDIERTVPSRYR
jgi:hypothetical protein